MRVAGFSQMRRRRPRINGFSYTGRFQYFLTICTAERAPIFTDSATAIAAASQILRDASAYGFAVPAYVVMPNHTHWLVEGLRDTSMLRPFVKMAKQRTGHAFRRERHARLWQSDYYDTIIRDDVQAWGVIRYIVENPVRAGLVETPEAYALWGSTTMSRQEILIRLQANHGTNWSPAVHGP